jgi:hypothetical protein
MPRRERLRGRRRGIQTEGRFSGRPGLLSDPCPPLEKALWGEIGQQWVANRVQWLDEADFESLDSLGFGLALVSAGWNWGPEAPVNVMVHSTKSDNSV